MRYSLNFFAFVTIMYERLMLANCSIPLNETMYDIKLQQNISGLLKDITFGLKNNYISIVYEPHQEIIKNYDFTSVLKTIHDEGISTSVFTNISYNSDNKYFRYLSKAMSDSADVTSIFFCRPKSCEDILKLLLEGDFIHRSLLYIFFWTDLKVSQRFLLTLHEAMKVAVITKSRSNEFHLYYNQASPMNGSRLSLVNRWTGRMYRVPGLPVPVDVYADFQGRVFKVPVLHAPPWHFVRLRNDSGIEVTGGRDDQLLSILANKLNFRYKYFDPPDHSQGTGVAPNGTFKGVLGMIYRREADFFLGDVTMTWERQRGVEFSFLTLADSGAFVTHAPRRLSEAFALLRPYKWEVWPTVLLAGVLSGPALWAAAVGPALWRPFRYPTPPSLGRCSWFTTSIFLRQSGRAPSNTARARGLILLLSLTATYVLGDVYSATLTSLLARPAREPPLSDLPALEKAMRTRNYRLLVERHSSSLAILQNGTGVYGQLWHLMQRQRSFVVRSVEQGVRRVLEGTDARVAFLAGRETLYFDTRRFGGPNFQLSEKLYTRYSAIALQVGCPYIQNFNKVLMQLFEAGILSKITSEEYEKIGESGTEGGIASEDSPLPTEPPPQLGPISFAMLQGAFYILIFGYVIAGIALILELEAKKGSLIKIHTRIHQKKLHIYLRVKINLLILRDRLVRYLRVARTPSMLSLDYIE